VIRGASLPEFVIYTSSMKPDAILRLVDLTVRYGNFVAVDGLNLELHPGELFGLLGPNGAGKSKYLARADRPAPAKRGSRERGRARHRKSH
jgi:ABC-type uncharacterized transport system ATPase subunit